MEESVVTFVLDHLAELVAREVNLLYGVEDRVQSLQYELQMIKELLNTTKRKKGMEHVVLNQIRDVAHLAEDVIDTFVAKVSIYKRRTILGRMLRAFGQARLLHHVAHKIDKLKTTLNEIHNNKDKYDAFKETTNQSAAEEKEENERLQSQLKKLRRNVEEEDVVGFDQDSKDIIKRLLEGGSNRKAVSIIGMGGLGKTTLARKVYNNNQVKQRFMCRAWVYVSNECRVKELLVNLLKHLMPNFKQQSKGKKSDGDINSLSEEELKELVRSCLERKRYLVIVDDLWKRQDWDEVQDAFPDNNTGSRILITSRLKEVALHAGHDVPHYLQFLNDEESWELFRRKVFRGEDYPFDLEPLGKQMVQSCRGLPLSIIVLAGLLANKEKSHREWCKVVGHVNWYLTQDETQVKDIVLKLSYDNLPRRLQPCFLYLGLFPEDFEIPVTPLLQKWVAEGFIQHTGNRDPYDVAEDYLYELIDRSLIQIARLKTNAGVKTCRVHDLLRDLCISESKEDKVFEVCTDNNILVPTKPRRLSIHDYRVHRRERKWLLKDFKLVRVLELAPMSCKKIPSNIGNFMHLKYLRIDSQYITFVPDSILHLWSLQTIDLGPWSQNTPTSFPVQVWKLKHLRHLSTRGPIKLRGSCLGSSEKMYNLQTISPLVLNKQATYLIEKGTFPNIKSIGLSVVFGKGQLSKLLQSVQLLRYLNEFVIVLPYRYDTIVTLHEGVERKNGCKPQELFESLGQFNCLTVLEINNVIDLLTCAITLPSNVTELKLKGISCISDEGMKCLGNHAKLKILRLFGFMLFSTQDSYDLTCVGGSFPQLEVFQMESLKIEKWNLGNGAMPRLQSLVISFCGRLDDLPNELWSLSDLKKVHVTKPSEQMIRILQNLEINNAVQLVIEDLPSWMDESDWKFFEYLMQG
ncbi:putative disease resistance RPP13-like protein 3 isoform X1 [Vigna radiata var. radiata]|uniref:Disease resistance RPP13-like protein 3 isoform X1 n=1 Tax=Vigna radiata var. radiata TaxID=3916 RepID=A0A3Q0EMK8_VIGRR|nr:putative disease resistance RPP13-like protein 3 isoform X1 [Vigna radiata var. radiata]